MLYTNKLDTSPCLKPNFWCPESSHHDPLCVPRDRVCDGSNDCPYSHADEGLCTGIYTYIR